LATVTDDSVVESNASCEAVDVGVQAAVIRCASNTWLRPHRLLEVKHHASSYNPSLALVTAAPGGTELKSNCTPARQAYVLSVPISSRSP
jgi:hypothetical protein